MTREELTISHNLSACLLLRLVGRVFHVTQSSSLSEIECAGNIFPSHQSSQQTVFGNYPSFFKNRNCVSLFDFYTPSGDQINQSIRKCLPIPSEKAEWAYLFLAPAAYSRLIPWTKWKDEDSHEMIVPYIEVGYPGPLPLSEIEEILRIKFDIPPNPVIENLKRGRSGLKSA